jgi:biotin carboxyl carrier protein
MMKIFAETGTYQFEFDADLGNDGIMIKAGDREVFYDMVSLGDGRYSLIIDHQSYAVQISKSDNHYHIHCFGEHFILKVEDERSRKLSELVKSAQTGPQEQEIRTPIPGLVVNILVNVGDPVSQGTQLLVLEAMKMENVIKAGCDCIVEKIHVKEKETVQLNQILLTLRKDQSV